MWAIIRTAIASSLNVATALAKCVLPKLSEVDDELWMRSHPILGGAVKESSWRSSGKKQEKPKQSHARRRQKKKQLKNMINRLREDSVNQRLFAF